MAFNIRTFKSNIEEYGYLKNNSFSLLLSPPPFFRGQIQNNNNLPNSIRNITDLLRFRVSDLQTPGITIDTVGVHRYGVGPVQKQPINAAFNDITFQIVCDQYGDIWKFWHNWTNYIFEFTGKADINGSPLVNSQARYSADYKSNYSTVVSIYIYDPFGEPIQRFDLYNAFPVAIAEVPYSWGSSNELVKIRIALTYKDYIIVGTNVTEPPTTPNNN